MLQFRSSSQSLPDRDGDILLLSQGSVNGKQVQSSGKGKEKARLTSSPLEDIGVSPIILLVWIADHHTEDRLWVDIYEPTTEVCHPQYSVFAAP